MNTLTLSTFIVHVVWRFVIFSFHAPSIVKVPVGKWNIYVANVAVSWRGDAESGGQVRSAIRTTISESSAVGPAGFVERGWCVYTYYWDIPAFSIGKLRVCF